MIMQIGPELSDLFWLASAAELEAVGAAQSRFWRLRRHSQLRTRRDASVGSKGLPLTELNHCSALVKFDAANGELYASQVRESYMNDSTRSKHAFLSRPRGASLR